MINLLNSNHSSTKSIVRNRGGYSQSSGSHNHRNLVSAFIQHLLEIGGKHVVDRSLRRIWKYAAMILVCALVGTGNVWGAIDWNSIGWIANAGTCSSANQSYKYHVNAGSPNVVEIQYPNAWASACGIYITFATDVGLSVNTLTANTDYKQQGAGIIFYLSYFTAQETTVTGSCNGSSWSFTIYNKNGSAGCTAPNHVDISGNWDYFGGETISLTAQAYSSAGTGSPIAEADITGYQWKHNGSAIVGATSKTFTKTNCTAADGGDYTCVVSTSATCSTESSPMGTKVYVLQCYTGGETSYNFTRTGSSQAGTTEVTLANNTQYEFKIYAGSTASTNYYMGNNGTIEQDASNWDFEGDKNNVKLNSGLGGTFTFAIDYSANGGAPKVSVTYPRKTIYMKCGSTWCDDSPVFFAHTYGVNNYDVKLTQDVCDVTIYYGIIPAYNSKVIFTRQKPGSESIAWSGDNYRNESQEITLATYDLFTCTGWSDGKGTFSRDTYSPTTYTISFEGNGNTSGSMTDVEDISCAEDVDLATNAYVRTGYTFSHWTANVDVKVGDATITAGSAIANSATIQEIASNITLTAQWTAKSCSITFDKNSGEGGDDGTTATYDAAMPTVTVPTRTGYTLEGYYDGENPYNNGTGTKYYNADGTSKRNWNKDTTDPTTLYARWTANKYDVTLNHENGDADATVQATFGSNMPTKYKETETTLVVPERSGYTFYGYSDEIGGGGTRYYNSTPGSAHKWDKASESTLYAIWWQYITLNREGGSGSTSVRIYYHSATFATTLTIPTKAGYTFGGYYSGDDGTDDLVINTNGTLQTSVTGYTDASGRWIHDGATTLYAKWIPNTYDVTLNHENGTPNSMVEATFGTNMPLTLKDSDDPLIKPTKSGYTFNGYYDAVGNGGARYYKTSDGNLVSAQTWNKTSDATLYARWRQYIKLDREDGTSQPDLVIANYHYELLTSSFDNPTKTGYTFGGYYDGDDGTGNLVINTDQELQASVTGCTDSDGKWIHDGASVTLHAKWTANTYDIAYKDGGDTEFSGTHEDGYPTTHTYGTATTLKSATKTGYTFGGWYTSSACTGAAVTSLGATAYTDDITLYAKWTIKTYTITLEDGGAVTAVSPTSVTATYNSSSLSSAITAPVQSGYTFGGWWTGEGGKSGSKVIGTDGSLQTSVAGYTDGSGNWTHDDDVTLYAKWDVEGGGGGSQYCDYVMTATDGVTTATFSFTHPSTNTYIVTIHSDNANFTGLIGPGNYCHVNDAGTNLQIQQSSGFVEWNGSTKTLTITLTSTGGYSPYFYTPFYLNFSGEKTFNTLQNQSFIWPESCGGTTYTVTYNANGADDGTAPVDAFSPYLEDATVTVLGNPHSLTKAGSTFNGWNTAEDGNGIHYAAGSTFTITNDVTLYAKWVSASGTTITLDANTANHGEAGNQSVTAVKGSALPDFTHTTAATGYQIEGYYTTASGEGTKIIHANKTLVANTAYTDGAGNWNSNEETLTLYARYEPCTYTISYYDQGGSAFSGSHEGGYPTTHTYGTATTLKGATKAGYNFDGWFTTTTCTGDPVTSLGATVYTANINLYAKWTDPTSCSQSGGAGSGDGEYIFATGYDLSIKRKAAVSSSNPDSLIISADSKGEGIGNIYLFFFETETSTEIFKEVQLATTASSVKTTIPIPSEMANDEYAYLSVKFEKVGGAMLTERMLFNLKEGGCEEPATTYFDIYHHDDAPVGARTSYEGGNIVVPIRYFRHFSHTDWTTITLPFEVSKVVVKEGEDEYDLYPRFNNGSSDVEGYYWLKTFNGAVTLANFQSAWQPLTVTSPGSTDSEIAANVKPAKNTPYVIAFPDGSYYSANWVIFYGDAGQTIASSFTGTSSITLTGEDYDYSKVQFVGNNTMHASGTLTNIYMIEEGYDYFTRCESASVPAFEAYVRGTEQVQRNYAILRYRGGNTPETPTDIDALPTTECRGAVYNLSGMKIATFAGRDAMEQVLNSLSAGIYIVHTGTEMNKVVVH